MCLGLSKINTQGLGINPMREKRENGGEREEKSEMAEKIAFQPIYSRVNSVTVRTTQMDRPDDSVNGPSGPCCERGANGRH
jgi:hypothetical protein